MEDHNHNQNALKNLDDDGKSAEEKADSFRLEGNESFRANDFKKAVELYSKSLEAKKTVPALLNRSFSYVKMERYEEALADADEALKMEPDNLKGKCRRGIALREPGRYSLALKEFADCLEREPESGSFQQLYDQCQKLADQKSFVNQTLLIVGYNNLTSGRELNLELVDGLLAFPQPKHDGQRFRSLTHLEAHINEHLKGKLASVRIEDTVIDEELMKFFRSLDPEMLATINMEFFNVRCSGANFAELFGGRLFRPLRVWFSGLEQIEMDMTTALSTLAALRSTKTLELNETRYERFYSGASKKWNNVARLDVDTVLDLLHQQHPDIPAHIRASPVFFDHRIPFDVSALRGERPMTTIESVTMLRAMSGRIISMDLDHFGGGKLDEIIQKCIQRFQSARSPVSYMLYLHIPYPPEFHLNPADFATLSKLLQRDNPTALFNGAGEKLTLDAMLEEFEVEKSGRDDHQNGQVVTVCVQRVHATR